MPQMATDPRRRHLLKGLGAATLLSPMASFSSLASAPKRLYIDGLSFLPDNLTDVPASKLTAYLCDISAIEILKHSDGTENYKRTYNACMASIKAAATRVRAHPDILLPGLSGLDIATAQASQRTAVFFQIQGADCIEEDSEANQWAHLNEFYQQGLRALQLTHHYGNRFAGGALDYDDKGGLNQPLSAHGRALIEQLNQRNILIDVSHASAKSALDAAKLSRAPIVNSHGAARGIVNHARCSPDEVIRAIADTGGVFGVFMMSFWLTPKPVPTIADYIRQLEYVMGVGGVECVAIANDFALRGQENLLALNNDNAQGIKEYQAWWYSLRAKRVLGFDAEPRHVVIPELNHIDRMSRIDDALAKARFKSRDRDRFLGGNWHRVLKQVLI
ncbi:MAG: membrane dipeptidase [Shewanella sp.]